MPVGYSLSNQSASDAKSGFAQGNFGGASLSFGGSAGSGRFGQPDYGYFGQPLQPGQPAQKINTTELLIIGSALVIVALIIRKV